MSVVQNSTVIARPAGEVFAYCSDMTNEPEWNPAAQKVNKVGTEPVGPGTRYTGQWSGIGEGTAEVVDFSPPERWRTSCDFGRVKALVIGRVQAASAGCELSIRIELEAHGLLALALPVVRALMQRTGRENMGRIRHVLERELPPGN